MQLLGIIGELGVGEIVVDVVPDIETRVTDQQQEARSRMGPVVPGMVDEVAHGLRVRDAEIEFVVDIVDVDHGDFHSALLVEVGQWPDRVEQ